MFTFSAQPVPVTEFSIKSSGLASSVFALRVVYTSVAGIFVAGDIGFFTFIGPV